MRSGYSTGMISGFWLPNAEVDQSIRQPIVQTTPQRQALAIYAYLFISFATYGHFVYLVINDITNYLGIACFTVRKRDQAGHWEDAKKVDAKKRA